MKRYSYSNLLHQRIILAGLTLGLVAVVTGVMIDILATSQRTTIPSSTRKLIEPLNPQLNLTVVEQLEEYELVTLQQAKTGTRQFLDALPTRLTPVQTSGTQPSAQSGSVATTSASVGSSTGEQTAEESTTLEQPTSAPSESTAPTTQTTSEELPFGTSPTGNTSGPEGLTTP